MARLGAGDGGTHGKKRGGKDPKRFTEFFFPFFFPWVRDLGWVAQVSKGKKKKKKKLVQNSPSQKRALLGFPSLGPKNKKKQKKG